MARLYDPETWLEENAKPSWKITLLLRPFYFEDTSMIAREQHELTGKEAGMIESLTRDYEDGLPEAGEAAGLADRLAYANQHVVVRIPRRNGGCIKFSMIYDHHEDSWFDCYNPPDSPKDMPVDFAELKKLVGKKKPAKKRPAKKSTTRKPRK